MSCFGFTFENTYVELPKEFYSKLSPQPVPEPRVVLLNGSFAEELSLDFSESSPESLADLFSGNMLPEGSEPIAQAYAGHQFGHFTVLGDGRAIVVGEHILPSGQRYDLQFKGSGVTPYSRGGDGRAALGPMLREYIISEAMNALEIATTRSLAVATTGERVYRADELKGAILTRVAGSHIRVGTFQFAALQGETQPLQALFDYTVQRHFPSVLEKESKPLAFLDAVMDKQADLIVDWMRVGFIHGVMNTDNMALSGETIDYGPCAFMDAYDPATVFSSIDRMGRYSYGNQPNIAQWNLARLAETLLPLIDEDSGKATRLAEEAIAGFGETYKEKWFSMMRSKLGLSEEKTEDESLVADLLGWMEQAQADYTNTFLDLSEEKLPEKEIYLQHTFKQWFPRWRSRLEQEEQPIESSLSLMRTHNPAVIPRNHKVEQALEAAENDDLKPLEELLSALREPYRHRSSLKPYQATPKPDERVHQTFCGT